MQVQLVTANRLQDGAVIFLAPDGGWSEDIADAKLAQGDDEAAEILRQAEDGARRSGVIGPYLVQADLLAAKAAAGPRLRPNRIREAIRIEGPTIHPQFRKG